MSYEKAQSLLAHYFKQLYESCGLGWNSDSEAEMGEIVESIKQAVISELKDTAPTTTICGACGATITKRKKLI